MAKNSQGRKVQVDVDAVTFGVEIECVMRQSVLATHHVEIGSYHNGKPLPSPFPSGWVAKSDGSIETPSHWKSLEIVSPVLHGKDGLEQVVAVFAILNEWEAQVNSSCGFHVHVGMRSVLGARAEDKSLVVRWVRRMLHLMSVHEMGLFALTGEMSRYENRYCNTIKEAWAGVLNTSSDIAVLKENTEETGRYQSLNLMNLFKSRGTVEFRLFAGTLDAMQALGYITLAMGIAHRAAQVGMVPSFIEERGVLRRVTVTEAGMMVRKTFRQYGWPTGARKAWGKAVSAAQDAAVERFLGGLRL